MNASSLAVDCEPNEEKRRYRYFPGWTIVGVSAAAQFMSAPGQSYSVAAFKEPMRESLRISETNYSLAYAFATIVSGVLLPFVGRMIDRHGARRMLPAIAFLLGLACLGMSRVSGLGSLYLGFSFVRSLGQGALSLIAAWLVGEWFARRRGFATAVSGLGGSLSVMSIPLLNIYLISHFGWQTGWVVLGFAVWGVLVLPSLFLVRDRPEELGLLPDGDEDVNDTQTSQTEEKGERNVAEPRQDWTVSKVMRDPTFWKLLAVPATSGMVGTGLIFHAVSLLGSRGVTPGWALLLISFQAIVATCMALVA
jgi:sugar phosphate permease